jgi:hypothetical protein
MSWVDKKKDFQRRYNAISSYWQNKTDTAKPSLTRDVDNLNTAVAAFIKTGGTSQDPANNPNYTQAIQLFNNIQAKKNDFNTLNNNIRTTITQITAEYDTGNLLKGNGNLQQDIIRLEKEKVEANNDADTAKLRDNLLKERDTAITKHQLFFLNRPVRSSAIPFLWGLSILFIAAAIIVFKQLFPGIGVMQGDYSALNIFVDPRIWMILTIAAAIVIIFLVLKIVGVFDPKNKPKPVE